MADQGRRLLTCLSARLGREQTARDGGEKAARRERPLVKSDGITIEQLILLFLFQQPSLPAFLH